MPGDEMLAKLRATDWGKDIKVVILTNKGEQSPGQCEGVGRQCRHPEGRHLLRQVESRPEAISYLKSFRACGVSRSGLTLRGGHHSEKAISARGERYIL